MAVHERSMPATERNLTTMAKKTASYQCEFGGVSPGKTHRKLSVKFPATEEQTRADLEAILIGAKLDVSVSPFEDDKLFKSGDVLNFTGECDGLTIKPKKITATIRIHREEISAEQIERYMYTDGSIKLKRTGNSTPAKRGRPAKDDSGDEGGDAGENGGGGEGAEV